MQCLLDLLLIFSKAWSLRRPYVLQTMRANARPTIAGTRQNAPPAWHLGKRSRMDLDGRLCGQCSGTIAQCLNMEHELDQPLSKLCIFRFKPLKQSLIARSSPITLRCFILPY